MWLSRDRTELLFSSARTGNYELYRATRASPEVPWEVPVLYYQSAAYDDNPFISEDGMLWFSNDATGDFELREAPRATPASNEIVLSSPAVSDEAPSLTVDGLTLYYDSSRDLFRSGRAATTDMFTTATRIDELSSPVFECCPSITSDGTFMFISEGFGNTIRSAMISQWTGSSFTVPTQFQPTQMGLEVNDVYITPDGLTVLFAARTATTANDIYSIDRECQ